MSNTKWILPGLVLLAISSYIYYDSQQTDKKQVLSQSQDTNGPTYKSRHMSSRIYDLNGHLNYHLLSENVEHYAQRGETQFTQPALTLYDANTQPNWHVEAKHATLTQDKMLTLFGQVDVKSLTQASELRRIEGSNVQINLVNRDIMSDDQVTLYGTSFTSVGRRLEGNLASQTAKLYENVNTYFGTTNE